MTQQRKFKHVGREDCFAVPHENTENPVNYDIWVGEVQRGTVPHWIVENYNDWQEIIPELVEGRWYVDNISQVGRWDGEYSRVNEIILRDSVDLGKYPGLVRDGIDYRYTVYKKDIEREATPDEIHKALEAIRIEKGLVEGVKFEKDGNYFTFLESNHYYERTDALEVKAKNRYDRTTYVSIYWKGNWASVPEPILVTEDNVKVFSEKQNLWEVDENLDLKYWDVSNCDVIGCKYFHHKQNAQAYIENHKPRFSKADLEYIEAGIERNKRASWTKKELCTFIQNQIQNLKQSK